MQNATAQNPGKKKGIQEKKKARKHRPILENFELPIILGPLEKELKFPTFYLRFVRVRRGLKDILKRAELGLAELGDIEHSLEERSRPRCSRVEADLDLFFCFELES